MYRSKEKSVIAVLVLTIITCGIYTLFWLYRTTSDLNEVSEDKNVNPSLVVLLSIITCGLYLFYWFYQIDRMILAAKQKVIASYYQSNYFVYFLLSLFGFSWVAILIVQSELNDLWEKLSDQQDQMSNQYEKEIDDKGKEEHWDDF